MASDDIDMRAWIGRTSEADDIVTPRLVASYRAMLGSHLAETDATTAPPGLHWCLCPEIAEAAKLGADGHPVRGDFLPPVPLPRRMWAGGEVRPVAPLRIGGRVRRRSTIAKVEEKEGRSGPLCFVTVRHELENERGPVIEEDQIIVYRGAVTNVPSPPAAVPDVPSASHEREVHVDPVLLFRYSALTFNGHRIHYDAPYAVGVEHYDGLVIHGPLLATLLLNFAAVIGERPPRTFSYRGLRPATGTQTLRLRGTPEADGSVALEVQAADGAVTMTALALW